MKNIYLATILFAALCGCFRVANAQPYLDAAQLMFASSPGQDNQPKKFNHFRASANIPVFVGRDSSYFLFNPIWDQRWIQESSASDPLNVRGLISWFSYVQQFNRKWSLQVSAIPRWMKSTTWNLDPGFQMGGAFLLSHKPRPGLKYQLGVYYNKELFGNFFLPLVGIDWKINARTNLFGVLPGYLVLENRIGKSFAWGGNFRTFTSTYRITGYDNNYGDDYLRVQDNQLGIYSDIYLTPKIVLNAEAGHTVMRRIATGLSGNPGKNNEHVLSDKDNFYFRLTLQYRLRFR